LGYGCTSTLRLAPEAIRPVEAGSQIDAKASLSNCSVIAVSPQALSRGLKTQTYSTSWSYVSVERISTDIAEALGRSRLFVSGLKSDDHTADLQIDLSVNLGCPNQGNDLGISLGLIVCTLDLWFFLGGPFPTSAQAAIVCELYPGDSRAEARHYASTVRQRGWASVYTIPSKDKEVATQSLAQALQNVVDQILADKAALDQMARKHARRVAEGTLKTPVLPAPLPPSAPAPSAPPLLKPNWKPENVAVADLVSFSLPPDEARTLSDRLRSVLVNARYFRVQSRNEMMAVLEAQKFQRSGACDESQCLGEMGKVLAVQKVVGGSIGKIGGTFSLTVRMVDVGTGEILHSAERQFKGEPDQLLMLIQTVAEDLCRDYAAYRKESGNEEE